MRRSIVGVGIVGKRRKKAVTARVEVEGSPDDMHRRVDDLDAWVELLPALIPLGWEAVHDLLQGEVTRLAGERYSRQGGLPGHTAGVPRKARYLWRISGSRFRSRACET